MRNNYQFSIYHTFVLPGRCPVLKPTVPDQERCLTVERNKMNNYKPCSSCVSTGQTNVQSELLSVPEITVWQVQLKAACRQSDEWSVETSIQKGEKDDKHNKRRLLLLILLKSSWYRQKKEEFPISQVPILKLLPDILPLFIATDKLFKLRLTAGRIKLYYSRTRTSLYILKYTSLKNLCCGYVGWCYKQPTFCYKILRWELRKWL